MIFAGLDIETTGIDVNQSHRLIQIGIVFQDGVKIAHDVQPEGAIVMQKEAMVINGFTLARLTAAEPQREVDKLIASQLSSLNYTDNSITPVGWNVGGFDTTFIKKELPKTAAFFSHRTVDLTGIAILQELRSGRPWRELKEAFAVTAANELGREARHDALYDAESALIALRLFKEMDME